MSWLAAFVDVVGEASGIILIVCCLWLYVRWESRKDAWR